MLLKMNGNCKGRGLVFRLHVLCGLFAPVAACASSSRVLLMAYSLDLLFCTIRQGTPALVELRRQQPFVVDCVVDCVYR